MMDGVVMYDEVEASTAAEEQRKNNEGIGQYAKVKKVDDPSLFEYFRSYSKDIKSSYTLEVLEYQNRINAFLSVRLECNKRIQKVRTNNFIAAVIQRASHSGGVAPGARRTLITPTGHNHSSRHSWSRLTVYCCDGCLVRLF